MNIKELYDEYRVSDEDDDYMLQVKNIINDLPAPDRILLLLYSEEQSLRKVAAKLGVSSGTVHQKIKQIREIIKNRLKND